MAKLVQNINGLKLGSIQKDPPWFLKIKVRITSSKAFRGPLSAFHIWRIVFMPSALASKESTDK